MKKIKNGEARAFFAQWLYRRTGFTPDSAEYQRAITPFLKGKLMVMRINESASRCQMFVLEDEEQK